MGEDRQDELIARTIVVWQARSSRRISNEDARQIVENAVGFFRTLLEWDETQRVSAPCAIVAPPKHIARGGNA
jgi:hypothetical protein